MHELSLMHALFDEADKALGPNPRESVRELHVRLGDLAGVEPELFRTAFLDCRDERGYPGAVLIIVAEPAIWLCRGCDTALAAGAPLVCPRCRDDEAAPISLIQGDALILERIELEVPDV